MIFPRRRPEYWSNYGCLTLNISTMTGLPDQDQETYLAVVKQAFTPTIGGPAWIRNTRYGIPATTSVPNWDTTATRYWANMYFRPALSDVMSGRKIMFEPILWIRQDASSNFMVNPNAGPDYFGRNSAGAITVANASNVWRNDIRANLDRLCWSNVT